MFEQSVVETRGTSKPWTLFAMTGQVVAAALAMTIPMIYPEVLNVPRRLAAIDFRLPEPPPVVVEQRPSSDSVPSSGGMTMTARAKRVFHEPGRIPVGVSTIIDPIGDFVSIGSSNMSADRLPGIPGGTGTSISVGPPVSGPPAVATRVAEPVAPPKPIRVGIGVMEAKKISQIIPVYPPLAKAARIQGLVRLEGVLAKDGTIQKLHVISGHPLLVQAALDAVKKWRYSPTLLNGEPVEVIAPIDVNFILSN